MLRWWPFNKAERIEERTSGQGFTTEVIRLREAFISGARGIGELTATAQSCVSLWEHGLSMADVSADLLDRQTMALVGRSLALRGEVVFLIDESELIPVSDWDLTTRNGRPSAYRLSIPEAGGGASLVALAGEVLHVRIGSDLAQPWVGVGPLRRAQLTASLLNAIESALSEIYETAPLGSQIVPFPESEATDLESVSREFRGRRGRVLLRESVNVSAAGGPAPQTDWRPQDMSPDLQRAMTAESLSAARDAVCTAFGVLPAMFAENAQGPLVREAQRHLAAWTLQPIAELLAQEASNKFGQTIEIDTQRPLQAYDAGGRARALSAIVETMARAKELELEPGDLAGALRLVDWD